MSHLAENKLSSNLLLKKVQASVYKIICLSLLSEDEFFHIL